MTPPITIFIVDDDDDDRQFLEEVVSQINPYITCTHFNNGQDALQALKFTRASLPRMIFLDLNMPRLNGFHCLEHLKKDKTTAGIPVIIYTTSKQNEHIEETKKSGAAHYIIKPTSRQVLEQEIIFVFTELSNLRPQTSENNKVNSYNI